MTSGSGAGKMMAVQILEPGGPEVLQYVEIDVPEPGPGEVAIQIGAAGVNFIDIYHRQGVYPMPMPFVPGREGAGRVIATGSGVTGVEVGDRVAWLQVPRSYAEVTVGPADRLIPVPDGLSDEQAAALALQGLTAQSLATDVYRIVDGDDVLIHAGAGGVGLLLTQIAKINGAGRVITTVSTTSSSVTTDSPPRPGISPTDEECRWCTTGWVRRPSTARSRPFDPAARWCCSAAPAARCRRSISN